MSDLTEISMENEEIFTQNASLSFINGDIDPFDSFHTSDEDDDETFDSWLSNASKK